VNTVLPAAADPPDGAVVDVLVVLVVVLLVVVLALVVEVEAVEGVDDDA
jgi:hypothetical protein